MGENKYPGIYKYFKIYQTNIWINVDSSYLTKTYPSIFGWSRMDLLYVKIYFKNKIIQDEYANKFFCLRIY